MKVDSLRPSFIQLDQFTVLDVTGPDAASFLHRVSTNHIENLEVGDVVPTCFLDQKGRLAAHAYVLRPSNDVLRVVVPYATKKTLAEWLDQFLFSEDAVIADVTSGWSMAVTIGEEHGFRGPDFHFSHTTVPSYFSLLPLGSITILDCKKLSWDEFEALRIAGGVPLSENEINQNFNPLQLGLENAVHWAKGCYIGQEVISRLESKEKAIQTLMAGRVEPKLLSTLKVGEAVHTDEGPVGVLTSVSPISITHEANVLVVLKRPGAITHAHTVLSKVRIDIISQRD